MNALASLDDEHSSNILVFIKLGCCWFWILFAMLNNDLVDSIFEFSKVFRFGTWICMIEVDSFE